MEFTTRKEPFARGYLSAGENAAAGLRIARGFLECARFTPLDISRDTMLAASPMNCGAIAYFFGGGISVDADSLEREIAEAVDEAERTELEFIRDSFKELDTGALIRHNRTPMQKAAADSGACWGGGWGGHANPDYDALLHSGTAGIREKIAKYRAINDADEFYDGLELSLDALDTLGGRYRKYALSMAQDAEDGLREKYLRIARAFEVVPMRQPRDFFEAVQFFWFVFRFDGVDSPGRFDQFMIDFWRMETDGRDEVLEALWLEFYKTRTWNLCISGSDENDVDASNELTYAILSLAARKKVKTPNLTMRVHANTPDSLWKAAAETIATGIGMPALYNDGAVCAALEAVGIPPRDSHLYCMNGCNQIDIMGKSHMGLEDGEVNLLKCLELTLNRGVCAISGRQAGVDTGDPRRYKTFGGLLDAFYRQVKYITDVSASLANMSQRIYSIYAPNALRSCLIEGCIEKGRDYKSGGPLYGDGQILSEGGADCADALAAIKHFVYDTRDISMDELLCALADDFEGHADMKNKLSGWHKFGNDSDDVDTIAAGITRRFFEYLNTKRTFRGGVYTGGCSPFTRAPGNGRAVGAMPNGRRRGEPLLADSIGASPGCDTNGPTALLKSSLKYPHSLACSGFILNLRFDRRLFSTEKGMRSFIALAKAYFAGGGQQLSVTVLDRAELLDAREHPELHRDLIVRVGGYSEYFVNLPRDLQDNVLARSDFPI